MFIVCTRCIEHGCHRLVDVAIILQDGGILIARTRSGEHVRHERRALPWPPNQPGHDLQRWPSTLHRPLHQHGHRIQHRRIASRAASPTIAVPRAITLTILVAP
jgi:hypothetical protein